MHFNGWPAACMPGLLLRSKSTSPHRPAIHHAASQENKENKGQRDEGSAPSLWASSATAPPRPGGVRVARGRFASTVGSTISRASCSDCTVFYMRTCLATNACNSAIWVRSCFSLVSRRHSGSNKRAEPKHKFLTHPPIEIEFIGKTLISSQRAKMAILI